jgi:hypothetical protein
MRRRSASNKSRNLLIAMPLFCCLMLALACGNENPIDIRPSGISGIAREKLIGGRYPPPPPTFRPLANAILTVQPVNGGPEIARTTSDIQGRFEIEVAPGTYLLVPQPPDGQGFVLNPPSQIVVVVTQKFALVTVTYIVPLP